MQTLLKAIFLSLITFSSVQLWALDFHIIRLGGLPSCVSETVKKVEILTPDYASAQFDKFLADLKKAGKSYHVTYSCIGPDILSLIKSGGQVDFRFQKFRSLEAISVNEFLVDFVDELKTLNSDKIPKVLQPYFKYVRGIEQAEIPLKTIVIGSSYGAWMAMQLISVGDLNVDLLMTVDAISPMTCNMDVFMKNWNAIETGCVTFPTDIVREKAEKIHRLSKKWINLYQEQFYFLRSTETEFADENIKLKVPSAYPLFNNHHARAIETPEIWSKLKKNVEAL